MGATIKAIKVEVCEGLGGLPDKIVEGKQYYVAINTFRLKNGIPYGDVYTEHGHLGYMPLTCFTSVQERS